MTDLEKAKLQRDELLKVINISNTQGEYYGGMNTNAWCGNRVREIMAFENMECKVCKDDRYVLQHCCGGFECGCLGMPISVTNCMECNPQGDLLASDNISQDPIFKHLEYTGVRVV